MDIFSSFLDHSDKGNMYDGYAHEWIAAFAILAIMGLIGYFIGWLMWRNCKRRYAEIEAENARIRAKNRAV